MELVLLHLSSSRPFQSLCYPVHTLIFRSSSLTVLRAFLSLENLVQAKTPSCRLFPPLRRVASPCQSRGCFESIGRKKTDVSTSRPSRSPRENDGALSRGPEAGEFRRMHVCRINSTRPGVQQNLNTPTVNYGFNYNPACSQLLRARSIYYRSIGWCHASDIYIVLSHSC